MSVSVHEDFHGWNRTVLSFYWLTVGLMLAIGQTAYLLDPGAQAAQGVPGYLDGGMLVLSVVSLLLMLAAEAAFRLMRHSFEYVLMLLGFLISLLIVLRMGDDVKGLIIVMDVPVVISLFYLSRRMTWTAAALAFGGFLLLYAFLPLLRQLAPPAELLVLAGLVVGTSFIGQAVNGRGRELLESLERAVHSEMEQFAEAVALESASKKDHLTGLYNHITYHEYAAALLRQHEEYGLPLQLALLDLDDFKAVNDTFGHRAGDLVLRCAARIVAETITPDDVAFRYGGEEFAVLLTGKSMEDSLAVMETVRARMAAVRQEALAGAAVTFSIGMADCGTDRTEGKDGLFKRADERLYLAKRLGKNRTSSGRERKDRYVEGRR